ncbi:hypothetical protein ACFWEH_12920 [Streptomyces anulatus]|uniref:hypothetical protein n=1 Tax=Streptomyces TaxID=1883 RepID=UPI00093E19D7|nr:hypothetical protein [Streptomyces sp. TSRI0395]
MSTPTPSEPITEPPAGDPPTPEPAEPTAPPAGDPPEPDAPLGPAGEKALAEWKARAKAAEKESNARAARLKEFEDRDKTEAEKLADRAAQAEERAANAVKLATSSKVEALAAGRFLDPQDAVEALKGGEFLTEDGAVDGEAITAALDGLLERKPHWASGPPGPRLPAPDPSQGARPGGTPSLGAQIADAEKAGDTRRVMALKTLQLREINKTK